MLHLSATCGYTFSYGILSSSYLFVTAHYWNFKLNLVDTYIDDVNLSKDTSLSHLLNNEGINNDDEDISII